MPILAEPSAIEVHPLAADLRNDSFLLGAEVKLNGTSLDDLSDNDEEVLREALYEHSVLVIRKAGVKEGSTLTKVCRIFDQHAYHGHSAGKTAIRDSKNILSANRSARLRDAPDVAIIGNGSFKDYEGFEHLELKHVSQAEFHAHPLSPEEVAAGQTRFYRWHLDAPLYDRLPGKVTVISCRQTPKHLPDQYISFEGGKKKQVPPGGTAFISGARAFSLLSPAEKEWAMNTMVQYAPRAYAWIGDCKATSDGVTIESQGKERDISALEPWTWDKVQSHPLVWRNPGKPERPNLIALGCCVFKLITTNPKTGEQQMVDDFVEARKIIHGLMKKAVQPEYVYCHRYEEDDLVIWHNHAVWHSVTGELGNEKRLMWQAAEGSYDPPEAARWEETDLERVN